MWAGFAQHHPGDSVSSRRAPTRVRARRQSDPRWVGASVAAARLAALLARPNRGNHERPAPAPAEVRWRSDRRVREDSLPCEADCLTSPTPCALSPRPCSASTSVSNSRLPTSASGTSGASGLSTASPAIGRGPSGHRRRRLRATGLPRCRRSDRPPPPERPRPRGERARTAAAASPRTSISARMTSTTASKRREHTLLTTGASGCLPASRSLVGDG